MHNSWPERVQRGPKYRGIVVNFLHFQLERTLRIELTVSALAQEVYVLSAPSSV